MLENKSQAIILYLTVIIAVFSFGLSIYSNGLQGHTVAGAEGVLKRDVSEEAQLYTAEQEISRLKGVYQSLLQTLMTYATMMEQNRRFHSTSGITEIRSYNSGTQPYHNSYTSARSPLSIHDHANYQITMGMGEIVAVLNGIEFQTRHNDYLLLQSNKSSTYHSTVPIKLPDVPPSVLAQPTVADEIEEMRQYFKAWVTQNVSHRDYRSYFKASLCYLEGNWIVDSAALTEPFASDRHFINAATWKGLNDKNRFMFASGRKDNLENLPYLPSIIHDLYIKETYLLTSPSAKTLDVHLDYDRSPGTVIVDNTVAIPYADKISLIPTQTSQGLYIAVIFGKVGSLQAGNANVTVTCNPNNNTGCDTATATAWCKGEKGSCNKKFFVEGSTTQPLLFTWAAATGAYTHPSFAYGPLTGRCFSVSFNFAAVKGVDGIITRIDAKNNLTSTVDSTVTIEGCVEDPLPLIANWEYRVLCQPIEQNLPTNLFRVVDDTADQMSSNPPKNIVNLAASRVAYFELNPVNSSSWVDRSYGYQLLDSLMETIPGKSNAGASLTDSVSGQSVYYYNSTRGPMNVAYYSRFYSVVPGKDAMGRTQLRRGFNDPYLFAAMTDQPNVAAVEVADQLTGERVRQRWSYAIPLEIIYHTPLTAWNPYKLPTVPYGGDPSLCATDGRNGGFTPATAYNGSALQLYYYWTPTEFFGNATGGDLADTSGDIVGVLDANGVVRKVRASGHYILFPTIPGVGKAIRQRYPIAPLSFSKNPGFMNARALKHLLATKQNQLLDQKLNIGKASLPLWTNPSTKGNRHFHRVDIGSNVVDSWDLGKTNKTTVVSEQEDGHTHQLTIQRTANPAGGYIYTLLDCDGLGATCPDGHFKMCLTDNSC